MAGINGNNTRLTTLNNTATMADRETVWKLIIGALQGSWGSGEWGTGTWCRRGNLWEGTQLADLAQGDNSITLPWPANNTLITVVPTIAGETQHVYVASGTTATITAITAGSHMLIVHPTTITRD